MRAINIKWDTDGDKELLESLPKEIGIPKGMSYEDIEDYISDQTGFCHFGFDVAPDAHILECSAKDLNAPFPCGLDWSAFYLRSWDDAVDAAEAIYGDAATGQLDMLEGAAFPCWALFWQDENFDGRCEGTLEAFRDRVSDAVRIMSDAAAKTVSA